MLFLTRKWRVARGDRENLMLDIAKKGDKTHRRLQVFCASICEINSTAWCGKVNTSGIYARIGIAHLKSVS